MDIVEVMLCKILYFRMNHYYLANKHNNDLGNDSTGGVPQISRCYNLMNRGGSTTSLLIGVCRLLVYSPLSHYVGALHGNSSIIFLILFLTVPWRYVKMLWIIVLVNMYGLCRIWHQNRDVHSSNRVCSRTWGKRQYL